MFQAFFFLFLGWGFKELFPLFTVKSIVQPLMSKTETPLLGKIQVDIVINQETE